MLCSCQIQPKLCSRGMPERAVDPCYTAPDLARISKPCVVHAYDSVGWSLVSWPTPTAATQHFNLLRLPHVRLTENESRGVELVRLRGHAHHHIFAVGWTQQGEVRSQVMLHTDSVHNAMQAVGSSLHLQTTGAAPLVTFLVRLGKSQVGKCLPPGWQRVRQCGMSTTSNWVGPAEAAACISDQQGHVVIRCGRLAGLAMQLRQG